MSASPTVSGVVLALNAAGVIDDCLGSLEWADQRIVLVDAATSDDTAERARAAGAEVQFRAFTTFAEQRNAALALAQTDWILFVDADERIPPALALEVRQVIASGASHAGYWLPRRNIICGRWIQHAGWFPDRQLRLLRRGAAAYPTDLPVHEVADLSGSAGDLSEPLVHLNYRSLTEFWSRQRRYGRIAASGMVRRGERPRARAIIGQPLRELHRRLIVQKGYREGPLGLALCLMTAAATCETQLRAYFRLID